MLLAQRVTETPNELTGDIDLATPRGMINLLSQVDQQLFSGWRHFSGLSDAKVQAQLEAVGKAIAQLYNDDTKKCKAVVFGGCGTSGRLSQFCCRTFNEELPAPFFHYLLAGGDSALVISQEAGEDDPVLGANELSALLDTLGCTEDESVVYVGITCGMSAMYVAGQLHYSLHDRRILPVLLGFNPPELARDLLVNDAAYTFREVVDMMLAAGEPAAYVVTPVYGPEAITGSTRMKGGSCTKIVLEMLYWYVFHGQPPQAAMVDYYRRVCEAVYTQEESLGQLTEIVGNVLNQGGHVCYMGAGTMGVVGLIDASEQTPTYGADYRDIRGFVRDGWTNLGVRTGDLRGLGEPYQVSCTDFLENVLPSLDAARDWLIVLDKPSHHSDVIEAARARGIRVAAVVLQLDTDAAADDDDDDDDAVGGQFDCLVKVRVPTQGAPARVHVFGKEFALKLCLNGISTGGHVLKGQVFHCRMINMKLSNHKLFFRAIGIVSVLTGVDENVAKECVLQSIYANDDDDDDDDGNGDGDDNNNDVDNNNNDVDNNNNDDDAKKPKRKRSHRRNSSSSSASRSPRRAAGPYSAAHANTPVGEHVRVATPMSNVVPVAIVLASQLKSPKAQQRSTVAVRRLVAQTPIVRRLLKDYAL